MSSITNYGTWNQNGDIVEGDKNVGLSQEDFNKLMTCAQEASKKDIAGVVSVLREINASQNDLLTEYVYTSVQEREAGKQGLLKKANEKVKMLNDFGTLGKSVYGIVNGCISKAVPIAGYLGMLLP